MISYGQFPQRISCVRLVSIKGSGCFVTLVFIKDQVVWVRNIEANVKLYFKLKECILLHVETEKCSIQEKYTFICWQQIDVYPQITSTCYYQRQELLQFVFKMKCCLFILWCQIIDVILTHWLAMVYIFVLTFQFRCEHFQCYLICDQGNVILRDREMRESTRKGRGSP